MSLLYNIGAIKIWVGGITTESMNTTLWFRTLYGNIIEKCSKTYGINTFSDIS